jgi:hypothetical protein
MSPLPPHPFAFALGCGFVGCHWYLGLAALAQRPTRVCSQFLQARLHHLAGYSPELGSHTPPIDFCSCQDFRARPRTSRLRPASCDGTNPTAQGIALSLRRGASRVFTAQGSIAPSRASQPPRRRPLRRPRIYPNLFVLRHPLSLVDANRGSEKPWFATLRKSHRLLSKAASLGPSTTSTVALADSGESTRRTRPTLRCDVPCRAASHVLVAKPLRDQPHPRCLPPPENGPRVWGRMRSFSFRLAGFRWGSLDTFVTAG